MKRIALAVALLVSLGAPALAGFGNRNAPSEHSEYLAAHPKIPAPSQVAETNRFGFDWAVIVDVQTRLKSLGYDPGPADGVLGARTRAAIGAFWADQKSAKSFSLEEVNLRLILARLPFSEDPSLLDRLSAPEEPSLAQRNLVPLAVQVAQTKCSQTSPGRAVSPREIARVVFPSVVLLIMEDQNDQVLSQGSGFVVSKGILVTNFHVVEGAASGVAKFVGSNAVHEIIGTVGVDVSRD